MKPLSILSLLLLLVTLTSVSRILAESEPNDFIAIINPPEAAILAIGGAAQVPGVKDGQLAIGWRMKATISTDHRVTDGAEAAKFMQALAKGLEEPLRLMV